MSDEYVNLGVEFTREQRYSLVKDWLAKNKMKLMAGAEYLQKLKKLRPGLSRAGQSSGYHDDYTRRLRLDHSILLSAYTLVKRGKIRDDILKSKKWEHILNLLPWDYSNGSLRSAYEYAGQRVREGLVPSVKTGFVNQIKSLFGL